MAASINSKLRLKNLLDKNETTLGTFGTLQGARAAQVLARTGVDVRRKYTRKLILNGAY